MKVVKRDGSIVNYDPKKVVNSLESSGVSRDAIDQVLRRIKEQRFTSISTDALYNFIYKMVRKFENKYSASIYSLKQAIMRLGPDGYAFEDFIAKILDYKGVKVRTRRIFESLCVVHELDVVGDDFFVECKYHNKGGINTSIKDVMYSHARFLDLKNANKEKGYNFKKVWIATNTRFSDDSLSYAKYWNIKLIGWKNHVDESLSQVIDNNHLYPVTLLPNVSKRTFNILNKNNILLITELQKESDAYLKKLGLFNEEIIKIRNDCNKLVEASRSIRK